MKIEPISEKPVKFREIGNGITYIESEQLMCFATDGDELMNGIKPKISKIDNFYFLEICADNEEVLRDIMEYAMGKIKFEDDESDEADK